MVDQAVEDQPPSGWLVVRINYSGTWDNVTKKVKWGPFFDNQVRYLTYTAIPPRGETGVKTFSGTGAFNGTTVPVGGDWQINLAPSLWHPADSDHGFAITIGEVTAYGAAWKLGQPWPEGPDPIPANYVTRAGFLWKAGETYHYDPSVDPTVWPTNPLVWQPGPAPKAKPPNASAGPDSSVR